MHTTAVTLGAIICVFADIFMNSMNAAHFATGEGKEYLISYWAFVLIAVSFAVNGPLVSFFGDKRAVNVAFAASALSALLSVTSVYTAIISKAEHSIKIENERQRIEENLHGKDDKIAACRADRYCVSEEMRARMKEYESELAALPKNYVKVDKDSLWYKIDLSVRIMVALFLPFVSAELCRQLGHLTGGPQIKQRRPVVVPDSSVSSHSSQPRNQELKTPEPKPAAKPKRGTEKSVPTDAEHEKIRSSYQALKREGHKRITQDKLREKAGKRKSMIGWWLKNTDEETRMAGYNAGSNIIPIGKVTKPQAHK